MAGKNLGTSKMTGFTIVELLIVIVVIAVLATLTVSAFQGTQAKARDSIRKADLMNIKKALLSQYNVSGTWARAGDACSTATRTDGFLSLRYTVKSMVDCLVDDGFLKYDIVDPSGARSCPVSTTVGCRTYMKVHCVVSGQQRVYIYASLETEANGTSLTEHCSLGASWDSNYGLNYALQVM